MRASWLARLLLPSLQRVSRRRRPDFEVTGDSGASVYLRRWWLLPRNDWFNVYLHQMLLDDEAVLHDHPYASLSLVLTDGLCEIYAERPEAGDLYVRLRTLSRGQMVWRSSRFAHRLIVREPAWTLFVTGPRVREWGFWCSSGWRPWQHYVARAQDSSGGAGRGQSGVGQGCGED